MRSVRLVSVREDGRTSLGCAPDGSARRRRNDVEMGMGCRVHGLGLSAESHSRLLLLPACRVTCARGERRWRDEDLRGTQAGRMWRV